MSALSIGQPANATLWQRSYERGYELGNNGNEPRFGFAIVAAVVVVLFLFSALPSSKDKPSFNTKPIGEQNKDDGSWLILVAIVVALLIIALS